MFPGVSALAKGSEFLAHPRALRFVAPVLADRLVFLLPVLLELAGQFDHDFIGATVGLDEGVDQLGRLVEGNVDGRVRHASDSFLTAFRLHRGWR